MKVTTNTVGNYSPAYFKQNVNRTEAVQKTKTENISTEEKKFFAELYPTQKEEVMEYQLYNAKGRVSGMHVGSLFDRRG
jgi:hypothetical protein